MLARVIDKSNFVNLEGYLNFCRDYLEYVAIHLQAVIVSQNENHYRFFQYDETGYFQITRPINSRLMLNVNLIEQAIQEFKILLLNARDLKDANEQQRIILLNTVYTVQQSIGATLDGLSIGLSNTARKLNGDLFERFIRLIIQEIGMDCQAGVIQLPVWINGEKAFSMSYQHDLIIKREGELKVLGSVKTSSKDRLDKIFVDKFLYNRLTETTTPHIAIFLNDVQRKNARRENEYSINSTFLPGHFKGYTVKLNPLDGVYYCDIRPSMITQDILKDHIKTFDKLIFEDIWRFIQ